VNISVLETLMKTYGTNRSLINVADNERARLNFYENQRSNTQENEGKK
jgi:hypothetical protein